MLLARLSKLHPSMQWAQHLRQVASKLPQKANRKTNGHTHPNINNFDILTNP